MDFNGDVEGLVRCAQPNSPALWGGGQGAGKLMEVRSPAALRIASKTPLGTQASRLRSVWHKRFRYAKPVRVRRRPRLLKEIVRISYAIADI